MMPHKAGLNFSYKLPTFLLLIVGFLTLPQAIAMPSNENKQVKDYGVHGHTFVIKEHSMLQVIQERLQEASQNGKIEFLQKQFEEKVKQKISNPAMIAGIEKTTVNCKIYFDPSYTQAEDVKDALGRIIVKKGTTVNPLDYVAWGVPLIFIDGEDEEQLTWGLKQQGKLILVKGSPVMLQDKVKRAIYFDQEGILTRKFGITHVPAIVSQEEKKLLIEEVVL